MKNLQNITKGARRIFALLLCLLTAFGVSSLPNFTGNRVQAAGEGLKVEMFNLVKNTKSNSIYPNFRLSNTGSSPLNLSDVKVRYYFTVDGEKAQTFVCDWSSVGAVNVNASFTKMSSPVANADYYLEIGFKSQAGSISAGGNVIIQTRFYKNDYADYTQTNDYSFDSLAETYVESTKVTAYISDTLVWGNIPGINDTQKPTVPSSLRVTSKTKSAVSLKWEASTDNVGVVGYKILRSDGVTQQTSSTTFTDTKSIQPDTFYSYTVQAYDASNNYSYASNSTSVITDVASYSINIMRLINEGKAALTYTSDYWNSPYSCFDGDLSTVFVAGVEPELKNNPAFVKVSFTDAQTIDCTRLFIGQRGFDSERDSYKIEAANTESDLSNRSGSYINIVPGTQSPEFKQATSNSSEYDVDSFSPVTKKIWKVTVKRLDSATHVHIPEIEFWTSKTRTTNIIEGPKNVVALGFCTTAKLTWNKIDNPNVAGYAVYRSSWMGNYDYKNPVGRVRNDSVQSSVMFNDFNLQAASAYYYTIAAYDSDGVIISALSNEVFAQTGYNRYISRTANLKLLVPIYTRNMVGVSTERLINSVKEAISFYYRNTNGKLNLEPTFMVIDGGLNDGTAGIAPDLKSRGVYKDQYDMMFVISAETGCFTGGFKVLGAHVGQGFTTDYNYSCSLWQDKHNQGDLYSGQIWIFLHEICHGMDALADDDVDDRTNAQYFITSDINQAYPDVKQQHPNFNPGTDTDLVSNILRVFDGYSNFEDPHTDYIEFYDYDYDGMANSDSRLPIDEERFGSSTTSSDRDNDGLTDMSEYSAGYFSGSDPLNDDTDNDGICDADDVTPLSDFSSTIGKFTQSPDIQTGTIDDSWTFLGSKPVKNGDSTLNAEFYSGWDDEYLYIGAKSNKKIEIWMSLDGSGQNGFPESDGYFVQADGSTPDWDSVKNTEEAYGDCYVNEYALLIDPTKTKVSFIDENKNGNIFDISQVSYKEINGEHILMCRIPKNLGPGFGYSYWAPGSSVIDGVRLSEDRILGFQISYIPFDGTSPSDMYSVLGIPDLQWSNLSEPTTFYKATLVR